MKKTISLLVSYVLLLGLWAVPAQADDIFPIGKTPWGSSRQQVANAIGIQLPASVHADGGLSVSGYELDNFDGNMGYVFLNDRLVEINFSIDGDKQPKFTREAAQKLKSRIERQFTKHYGKPKTDKQQCDNVESCQYSIWNKNSETAVGLFFVDDVKKRNLGISYMQRKENDLTSPFYQPNKGLVILPQAEDRQPTDLLR